ncbi:MAG: class IV adenylate cyclase [Bacteroidota bacterium]
MPKNLELKASYYSLAAAHDVARRIGARHVGTMRQTDTYYRVRSGRLKLREINRKTSELIYYERANRHGSRYSTYAVIPLQEARAIKKVLRAVLGELIVVRKERTLFLYKNCRIHLDRVQGLGLFIEFEVLARRGKRQAEELMRFLRTEFGIHEDFVLAGSYSDLLQKRN